MESLKTYLELVYYGASDCICGSFSTVKRILFSKSKGNKEPKTPRSHTSLSNEDPKTILQVFLQCLVFGTVIGLTIFLYSQVVTRFFDFLVYNFCPDEKFVWVPEIMNFMFFLTWKVPLFCLSRALTLVWYQNIATLMCEDIGLQRKVTQSFSVEWSEQLMSALVQTIFLIQGYVILSIAYINEGPIVYLCHCIFIVHLALLYSLYAFEYKWCQKGWSLNRRLEYIENKWPYFVGFGLPLAALTSCFEPYVGSMCFFIIFFPITLLTSTVTFNKKLRSFNIPFPAFYLATPISDWLIRVLKEHILKKFLSG